MKKNQIKSIVNDILELENWANPLNEIFSKEKYEMNLLTGKRNFPGKDSITELLLRKRKWFVNRIKNLKGNLKDFEKAKITVNKNKESVEIIYQGRKFEDKTIYNSLGADIKKIKAKITKLKPIDLTK